MSDGKLAPALPFDVLDIIADLLRKDIAALKAACLVSNQWRPVFQRILFSNARTHSEASSKAFLAAICGRPSFRSLVKSLEIKFIGRSTGNILYHLPRLEKIIIRSKNHILPSEFCDAFRLRLQSKYITSLTLDQVDLFPLPLLNGVTALKHLSSTKTLYFGKSLALVKDAQMRDMAGPKLHSLSLSSLAVFNCELLKWLADPRCILDLQELQSLEIFADSMAEVQLYRRIFPILPPTLSHLTYKPPSQGTPTISFPTLPFSQRSMMGALHSSIQTSSSTDPISLKTFTHLQTLTLHIFLSSKSTAIPRFDHVPWCTSFLSTLPNPSNLQTLSLVCTLPGVNGDQNDVVKPSDISTASWSNLDNLLSSPTTVFSNLKDVLVYLPLRGSTELLPFKTVFMESLLGLDQQRKLSVLSSDDLQ